MDERGFRQLISGETRGATAAVLRALLQGASWGWAGVGRMRNRLYDVLPGAVHRAGVPVISIGNLTTGGTGKTPVVAMVADRLRQHGRQPGIVSRGYRAGADGTNDEQRVLALKCPRVPHKQHPRRTTAVRRLLEAHGCDVILMDDGFQHRRLHRDFNVVLIDATCPFGYGYVLPRGLLREPLSGLRRADYVLLTRSDQASEAERDTCRQRIARTAPHLAERIAEVRFPPTGLLDAAGERQPTELAAHRTAFLMSGIGNPQAFRETCEFLRSTVVGEAVFADHHHYSEADLRAVREAAARHNADLILTTVKDLVKLPTGSREILAVDIGCEIPDRIQRARFETSLEDALRSA